MMDSYYQRETLVQNPRKNIYGSESLYIELNVEEFIRNEITVCDFSTC